MDWRFFTQPNLTRSQTHREFNWLNHYLSIEREQIFILEWALSWTTFALEYYHYKKRKL